ncbi:MAG: hypothetical protein A3A86_08260 [Elusimicrobia bacterium RIFCSPLOWO2_01_FULL_60_11]|nr:MAG: hypothetical protein A3A86_08260 [Elusimicrobia bacterium RIFCSPLOWO2_01_FULL_60_11]
MGFIPELFPERFRHKRWAERWTGSGFLGTLLALALGWSIQPRGMWGLPLLLAATALAVWLSGTAESSLGNKDDHRIVVDEIVGYFWTIAYLPAGGWAVYLAAFALFRAFDTYKIPSRGIQNLPGGWGVMMDDVLSGITANLILHAALALRG